jgi:hypothetical protein
LLCIFRGSPPTNGRRINFRSLLKQKVNPAVSLRKNNYSVKDEEP